MRKFYRFQFKHEKGKATTDLDVLRWLVSRSFNNITSEQLEVIAETMLYDERDILMFNNLFDLYVKALNIYYMKGFHRKRKKKK